MLTLLIVLCVFALLVVGGALVGAVGFGIIHFVDIIVGLVLIACIKYFWNMFH